MLALFVAVATVVLSPSQPSSPPEGTLVVGVVREQGTGAPIAGAQVTMIKERTGPPPNGMPFERPPQVSTDPSGRFEFRAVMPGCYRFTAQKAGFAFPFGAGAQPAVVTVPSAAGPIEIALPRGGVLVGRVLDANGEPLANAMVTVMRPRPGPPARTGGPAQPSLPPFIMAGPGGQTNELGEFRLHSLAAGEYVVRVMARPFEQSPEVADGHVRTMVPTYAPGTTDANAADTIGVQAGGTADVGDIRMVSASAFRITGVVVDAHGRPVAGALVRLIPANPMADMMPMAASTGQHRTDPRGAFTLENVVDGAYTLIAIAPVVIAKAPRTDGVLSGGSSMSMAGVLSDMVTTETRDGTTVQFRDDAGTRVPLTIAGDHVAGLQVVLR